VKVLQAMTSWDETLDPPPLGVVLRSPRMSPDGVSVAVEVRRNRRGRDLWLLRPNSEHRVVLEERFDDSAPRFGRDGASIYFQRSVAPQFRRRRAGPREGPLGGGDVCAIHLQTSQVRCIGASEDAREYAVEASPTRAEVVFLRETEAGTDLFLADSQGDSIRALTTSPEQPKSTPRWSPDGEQIAFVSGAGDARTIRVVARDGRQVLETPGFAPAWAPPDF
jgi:Tol biopolymer transport system component